jgi:hypothetical protein
MKLKALFKEYLPASNFSSQGIPLRQDEYDGEVVRHYSSPIVQNEIHGLLNEYALKVLECSRHGKTKECDMALGALEVLELLLLKGEKRKEKVTVLK